MIDQKYAIIAHLDVLSALDGEAKCRLVLCDLEAGRTAGDLCVLSREWENRKDVFSIPTDDHCVSVPVPVSESPPHGERGVESVPPGDPPNDSTAPAVGSSGGTQPATGSVNMFTELRRAQLLVRHRELTKEQKATFKALQIPKDDLDGIAKALEEVASVKTLVTHGRCKSCRADIVWTRTVDGKAMPLDPIPVKGGNVWVVKGIAVVAGEPPIACGPGGQQRVDGPYVSHFATCPRADQHRKPAVDPFEGRKMDHADYVELRRRVLELGAEWRTYLAGVADAAAEVGGDFRPGHGGDQLTLRRYDIHRGLIYLAEWLGDPSDEVLEAAAYFAGAATGFDDPVGGVVGSLDAAAAERFADVIHNLATGRRHMIADTDGYHISEPAST